MKKFLTNLAAIAIAAAPFAACSGGTNSSSDVPATAAVTPTDAVPPSTAAPDHYAAYVQLATQLNAGHIISKADADTNAALICSGARDSMTPNGSPPPLRDSPTALALVRAYCPDIEQEYP